MQPLVIAGETWSICLEESVQHNKATCVSHAGPVFCIAAQLCSFSLCAASALKFQHCSPPRDSTWLGLHRLKGGGGGVIRARQNYCNQFSQLLSTHFSKRSVTHRKRLGGPVQDILKDVLPLCSPLLNFLIRHEAKKHCCLAAASQFLHFCYKRFCLRSWLSLPAQSLACTLVCKHKLHSFSLNQSGISKISTECNCKLQVFPLNCVKCVTRVTRITFLLPKMVVVFLSLTLFFFPIFPLLLCSNTTRYFHFQ